MSSVLVFFLLLGPSYVQQAQTGISNQHPQKHVQKFVISPTIARLAYVLANEIMDLQGTPLQEDSGDSLHDAIYSEIETQIDEADAFDTHGAGDEQIISMLRFALSQERSHRNGLIHVRIAQRQEALTDWQERQRLWLEDAKHNHRIDESRTALNCSAFSTACMPADIPKQASDSAVIPMVPTLTTIAVGIALPNEETAGVGAISGKEAQEDKQEHAKQPPTVPVQTVSLYDSIRSLPSCFPCAGRIKSAAAAHTVSSYEPDCMVSK